MATKICIECGKEKSLDEFYNHSKSKDKKFPYCKECTLSKRNEYNRTHPDKKRIHNAKDYQAHKEAYAKRSRANQQKVKREVINHYGGKCACCGENTFEFLAIDHIHNNGAEERRRLGITGGWRFAYWLREQKYPQGYQILCHNCNSAKEFYGSCPHQKNNNKRQCTRNRNQDILQVIT